MSIDPVLALSTSCCMFPAIFSLTVPLPADAICLSSKKPTKLNPIESSSRNILCNSVPKGVTPTIATRREFLPIFLKMPAHELTIICQDKISIGTAAAHIQKIFLYTGSTSGYTGYIVIKTNSVHAHENRIQFTFQKTDVPRFWR